MSHLDRAVPLLHDFLQASAARGPADLAVVAGETRLSYGELDRRSNALAHTLVQSGVRPHDAVAVYAGNEPETIVAFWAALKASAIATVISPQTRPDKLGYMLGDCRPAAFICQAGLRGRFETAVSSCDSLRATVVFGAGADSGGELPWRIDWAEAVSCGESAPPPRRAIDADLAAIIYTSGSTGEPKGVMQTHASMRAAATSITTYLQNLPGEIILCALPLSFDYGLYQAIMAALLGGRLVLEKSFAYPVEILRVVERERVTGFPGVPTMFAMLRGIGRDLDLSSVRYVTNTAAALGARHVELIRETFPAARIYSMYGLTECKRVSFLPPEEIDRKPESVGIAIPNTEISIVGSDGRALPPGQTGEIVVRGATLMRGYLNKPEATARRLRPGPSQGELVLHTGDYGRIDEEGYLYFVARMDDIIKSAGEKVPPREVEDVLLSLEGIREAAVIGAPDERLGEAVLAFVVLDDNASLTESAIRRLCQARLESHMVPLRVEVVPEIPKTTNGKIDKTRLAREANRQGA
jgi:amino acid adenylation domain-containing protein